MNITYNNLGSPSSLVTFTDVPNILKVIDSAGGSYANLSFNVDSGLKGATSSDGQWSITFLGETITNVLDPSNAVNKNFYVSNNTESTVVSMARAFRNCPTIAAYFNVEIYSSRVALVAKSVGTVWKNLSTDLQLSDGLNTYVTVNGTNGMSYSNLLGALIDVDVYREGEYLTTLEKSWYDGEAAFNMSPVLTTISKYGETVPYSFKISSFKNGEYSLLGNIDGNYTSVGYMVNQGNKYLSLAQGIVIAQNVARGASRASYNNMLLYVYAPRIPVSLYTSANMVYATVTYLDSAFNTVAQTSASMSFSLGDSYLKDGEITLNSTYLNQSFYVDISIDGKTLRYNVIKPMKATEYSQRILWRNSYGGVSFFDFTGSKTETRDVDITTYQKNIFGYYTDSMNELEKVYNNDVKYTVTLKSHLFENDGKYIFNDLIQSSMVWTQINGQNYGVIVDSVSVDETDNNNIYEATIKYHYSQEPSLI